MQQQILTLINNPRIKISMPTKPYRVWTWILDEPPQLPVTLMHNQNAFFEDRFHDWSWEDGVFRYYPHSSANGDLCTIIVEQK